MKISQLIEELKNYQKEFGDVDVITTHYDDYCRDDVETEISYITKIDNTHDKRLKQKTTIVIH